MIKYNFLVNITSFAHSSKKYLLNTYYVVGAGDTIVSKGENVILVSKEFGLEWGRGIEAKGW